jgi:hypothetical protein
MIENKRFVCSKCGKVHEEWPALTFTSPTSYAVLSEQLKIKIGELSSDFCIVRHPEQTDRFIRGTLTLKVNDYCQDLDYGLWVSLSESSFQDYSDNYGSPNHSGKYFGWLSNDIPEYEPISNSIPTTVFTRTDGLRPEIIPHENFDHPLVRDYYEGITKVEAETRIEAMLKSISAKNDPSSKTWWKFWK